MLLANLPLPASKRKFENMFLKNKINDVIGNL